MVRETRHLWVGNLPDNIREDRIREHFKRYGRVQSVKLLPRCTEEKTGEITMACTVAFMDIKSASKAHNAELKLDDRTLNTEYYEPAAIPSAALPQNTTPSPYSTSPGTTRFPNGHGSSDEHGIFPERFYEKSTPKLADGEGESTRRGALGAAGTAVGYHDANRGRNRDRAYRNGPHIASAAALMDRHSRTANAAWTYESTRYNNTTGIGQTDTGYSTTPSENNERRNSDQSSKKKTKSRSGSRSPSPSGSTSSRSPSRSRSRSSSSSSSSSTSRDTCSTSSPKSRRLASTANSNHEPVVHSDDRRPLAICVKNLPVRSSDTSLKDGLFHEYKKHGKVTWVKVVGKDSERHAIVCFKKPEDVEKAIEVSYDKLFFGCKIEVAPYQGYDVEDNDLRPYEAEIDEFHPKATRTLFIGNLEKDVTASDLRKHFDQFGEIIEIDIKKQGAVSSYAFCQYSDIVSVVKAIRKMDGEHLGGNRVKLGFGKSMAYNCVWVDGVNESVNEKYLKMQFDPFGVINKVHIDREKGQALIFYEQVLNAQAAVNKMRGFSLKNTKIQVDFASRECQESFFERIEKQGTILDRSIFEERRDSTTRTFDATTVTRFSRYDTPTRPRTSSYSSRSSVAASQVTSVLQSPGTPGSVTPRGSSSRSRSTRFAEYYDQTLDYSDRHFRSYDEYSQGSAASPEDVYEHEYAFVHDSPTHLDPLQGIVDNVVPFAPPDMRNLQKERVHLLEQLEECPSSGDELICPKKRLKIDLLDSAITSDVIIEANRDHRKVMEVRRLSDVSLKHHSRRPSIDSAKHLRHDVGYLPHTVCKRRKTAGSDSGSKVHQYDHSESESVGGSRPGTPLCDERPENFQHSEPRRVPREREGPLTLPLPRFAAQITNRGSVSVAGIKGQKDNVLSSPPPAVTSPRISNPRPPSPVHVPPPASPPPRPPSLSSNSSDSDNTPPSPSLEERIKSLDEKYEKWSGSRALSAAGGDALALLDANLEKFRQRHKILDLDLKEVQPSEIVKSVMAKRSVFDEDLKRLENVGEKYEPKEFLLFPRSTITVQTSVPATPLPALKLAAVTQLPKTPTMLSPRSAGANIPAAKGLQYPFPTHPPLLMSPVPSHPQTPPMPTTSAPVLIMVTTSTTASTTATTTRGTSHGENRLKPCPGVPSDNRTSSKMNVNKSTVVSSLTQLKVSEKSNTPNANATEGGAASDKPKPVREMKSSEKTSEKVVCRRDSNSNSPRADIKTRRNSDSSVRRIDESDTSNKERAQSEERKRERFEKIKIENEKLEKEKSERERIERERLENEKQEKIRLEKERLEKERLERESELEKQRLEKERLEKERLEKERLQREQQEKELAEKEKQRLEREQLERERLEREKALKERERVEKEKHERNEKDRLERERVNKEKREKEEKERRDQEQREREKLEKERREQEQREREDALKKEHLERERIEREEQEQKAREEQEKKERVEKERREFEMIEREKVEKEKHDRERQDEENLRHKDENPDKKKDDHKHREGHGENKNRENNIEKHLFENKSTKDSVREEKSGKDINQINMKELHDPRTSHDKNKLHLEKDVERRKENVKENRENNVHDKHKGNNENIRGLVESRHMSIDLEKNKILEKLDPTKRKERNNSLPANIGSKRRLSSHDIESSEESKKPKLVHDHKKLSERRDSKDSSRSEERSKNRNKNNISKSHDKHNTSRDSDEKRKEKEERHKKHKLEKLKAKSKSREKESQDSPSAPKSPLTDKEFLNRLDLRSIDEIDKHQKESKEKRKENVPEDQDRCRKEKMSSGEKMNNSEKLLKCRSDLETISKTGEERRKRDRVRKLTNSSDSDSDEPKKHSIFDIVDDEPAYISMYDKVKARSCKNMAKLEEEKRQEKLKAKFNQLKQSRAKREEKKRSTSWDEDSDSEKDSSEMKIKRSHKVLIDSSDDESQERKSRKKKDIYSDSDCSAILKHIKQEPLDTSDDESKNKNLVLKAFKSRITSDTSEDEYNKKKMQAQIKIELFSDAGNSEIQGYSETDEKLQSAKVKDELERMIKKERHNSKLQEPLPEVDIHVFSDISMSEIKTEKFNNVHSFIDNTSDEDNHEITKKERSERKEKKHRRKQKKQKHSLNIDDPSKLENISDSVHSENTEKSRHEKKKEHSKKEKRRDKTREGREKSKKSKKNKLENKSEGKRDGKMENIFGSLSEDSENGTKDLGQEHKPNTTVEEDIHSQITYNSESEKEPETKIKEKEDREREREEHHKKKKEKKRRERERRLQEAAATAASQIQASNENSMDFADMGKQLEANMMQDESLDGVESNTKDIVNSNCDKTDPFRFTETVSVHEIKREKEDRKEGKEKKKKRKKSKDEKSKHHHHHHHHHHDKNKSKTPEIKKEILPTEQVKLEIQEPLSTPTQPQNPSLPTILDETIPNNNKNLTPDFLISPMNPIISPIPKTPTTSKEKKREKFLPGFGTEIDEKIHDSAVKSISDFETTPKKEDSVNEDDVSSEKPSPLPEEKPRVVISQEETEDAVAALLGESFGVGKQEAFYNVDNNVNDPPPSVEESNVQDDEEMRQAVQSLSASDLDVKPDTPQSEHELQIDTDTEEQDDAPVKFDPPTKTPEPTEIEKLPKTLETPSYFRKNTDENTPKLSPPKDNSNIGSPPSLTPIRQQMGILAELRKNLEQKSLPVLTEQTQRTVIAQSWAVEKKQDVSTTKPPQASVIKIENKTMPVPPLAEPQQAKTITPSSNRQFSNPPNLKITEPQYPPLKALSKTDRLSLSPTADQSNKVQNVSLQQSPVKSSNAPQLHNLPARSPVQMNKPPMSVSEPGLLSPKLPAGVIHSRLPITPVMAPKPLQPSTVILQQAKIAHPLEPPKLVSTSDHRSQDRSRMVFQTSTIQPPQFGNYAANQPRMMIQGNIRHLPPQGLLVTTRQLPASHNFGYLSNIPHSPYNLTPISKEKQPEIISDKNHLDPKLLQSFPPGLSVANNQLPSKVMVPSNMQQNSSLLQPLTIPKELTCLPCTPAIGSPKLMTSSPSPKPFMPMCSSPKLQSTPPPNSSSPKLLISVSNSIKSPVLSPKPVMNSTISSSVESPIQTSIIQPVSRPEHPANVSVLKHSEVNQLNVITELKRSTPSPVIATMSESTPKIVAAVSKLPEVVSDTQTNMKLEDEPIKLAIEEVTDELNLYLEKASPEIKDQNPLTPNPKLEVQTEEKPKDEPKLDIQDGKLEVGPVLEELHKTQIVEKRQENKQETEQTPFNEKDIISFKETDKFDEEKTETESIISNVSKERSASADILAKDDPLDTKEDSDYWSAKEVNIDSVIKTLCSGDELSDHSSENGKDDWFENKSSEAIKSESAAKVLIFEKKEEKPCPKIEVYNELLESRVSSFNNKTESIQSKSDESMESRNDQCIKSNTKESVESKIIESVGSKINESVESKINESVECKVKESVESKIIDTVESKTTESVESKTTESAENKIIESVESKIIESVEGKINEYVESKIRESKESKIRESKESKISESVENKIEESAENKNDKPSVGMNDKSSGSMNDKSSDSTNDKSSDSTNDLSLERNIDESTVQDVVVEPEELKQISSVRNNNRGRGGRARGRGKTRGGGVDNGGIQTRRAKLTKELTSITSPTKRGRGGRTRNERKVTESESETTPADIYEFRDDSDEANKEQRPRLILTIKSPAVSSSNNSQTTATFKEITKDGAKEITKEHTKEIHLSPIKPVEPKEEFTPPAATNTRKSRRLQEKDTSRNTVDDTIEDVIKNTIQTRASSNQRRSTRQAASKPTLVQLEVLRKSPRGRKGRRCSEATETSSSEETPKEEPLKVVSPMKEIEKPKEADKSAEVVKEGEKQVVPSELSKEKPIEGLKTVVLRRLKGDTGNMNPDEPTNLIDPVTGELIPMRESEEGKYVPLPGSIEPKHDVADTKDTPAPLAQPKLKEMVKPQTSVIAQTQQVAVVQQTKLQSFKAHVLSSQAAHAVVSQQPVPVQVKSVLPSPLPPIAVSPKNTPQVMAVAPMVVSKTNSSVTVPKTVTPIIITKTVTPIVTSKSLTPVIITKPVTPISQHLSINTSLGLGAVTSTNLSPRPIIPSSGAKPIPSSGAKPILSSGPKPILSSGAKPILSSGASKPILVKPPPVLSPVILSNQQKILQVSKQQQMNKSHLVSPIVNQGQMMNTQLAHLKHQPVTKQQQVVMGKGPMVKPLHQQQILSGAVASPPLSKSQSLLSNPSRIIQGPLPIGPKGVMEPPKVDVSVSNVILGQRPKLSPQGPQQRLVGQTGLPVPGYEASLHGERSLLNRSRSPPPAHQNSPSPKGETIAHYPPGSLRPPPEISPAHYMHPPHVIQYQQYLRQQQLHLTRSGGIEKVGDGQEGEEAPVTSPPLELRRPGSVGLALAGRGAAVPHSLHSPHDRATDSPQVGQVYNVHPTRLQHYHPNRYHFEQTEPPPAHRPMTSHGSLAALGSDRGLAHMSPMSTPDRPLSGHSALTAHMGGLATPDRPISNHVDRPISSHVDRPISSHVDRPLSSHGMIGVGLGAAGNLMGAVARHIGADTPTSQRGLQAATPPHASQVPPQAESLFMLLKQYPCMWQGLLALKNDQAAVQMYFVSGNDDVAKCSLPKNTDGSTPPLRIFQRMRLEPPQVEGVARKMQMENEHCMLLALPCGHDHMDVLKQSNNLTNGFITYLQQKQAAGIVNVAAPGTTQPPAYVVHIFPSCDFVNENLRRIAPSLLERVADIAHLLIVITTV